MSLTILLVGKNEVYDFLILHYTYWYEKIGLHKKLFSFINQLQKIGFARNLFVPHYPIAQKKGKWAIYSKQKGLVKLKKTQTVQVIVSEATV